MDTARNTSDAVIARLHAWASANGWTKSRFASEAGLVDTTLRNFGTPGWNPTRDTLRKLEATVPEHWQPGDPVPAAAASDAAVASAGGGE